MGRLTLLALSAIGWFFYLLPSSLRRCVTRSAGFCLRVLGLRRRIVEQNLAIAYPGDGIDRRNRRTELYRAAYEHLAALSLEIMMLLGPMPRFVRRSVELRGLEHWREAKKHGKGVVFLASHVGNWEVMAAAGGIAGVDIMLVTKHLRPEWLHQAIAKGRLACNVRATYEPRTLRDVLGHLKRNGTIGFVLDQYAGPPVGVRVPVFGVPVGTHTALATLIRRTGAALLPVVNYRTPDGRVIVDIAPPIAWEAAEEPAFEIANNTARYASVVEADIRAHADQWLWIHRRFKGDLSPLRPNEWTEGRARQ